jgi:GNAT superfamily N-acetyltransferase
MAEPIVREMDPREAARANALALGTFATFVARDCKVGGEVHYAEFAAPERIAARMLEGHVTLAAEIDGDLAGFVQLRRPGHVLMLFVDERYHRRGIARALVERVVEVARKEEPALEAVTVNSSLYAVEAYRHLGFVETEPRRTVNGIPFVPMRLELALAAEMRRPA